jgi:hypothetical protein
MIYCNWLKEEYSDEENLIELGFETEGGPFEIFI